MRSNTRTHTFPNGVSFQIRAGDLTAETTDAIVNAANSQLQHGGGVAGIIARKGGPKIQQESHQWVRQHGPVDHANPAITSGGQLACKYIIHAVGPIWGSGSENQKLVAAILGALKLADQHQLTSIAFPAISTGIFGFPKKQAAAVFVTTVAQFCQEHPKTSLKIIRITLFDSATQSAFLAVWDSSNLLKA